MRVDLHAHTHFSRDGLTSPATFARRYQRAGVDVVAVSDHNNIDGALAVRELAPFPVIVSEEVRTAEGEIIGYFLRANIRKGMTPEETVAAIRAQGGLVCVPHPFDTLRREPLRTPALLRILNDVDIIEVFNSRTIRGRDNDRALAFARDHGKLMSAGTDAHTPWEIGLAWTEMPPFEGPGDFLAALGQGTIHGRTSFIGVHALSTWAKIKWALRLGKRTAK